MWQRLFTISTHDPDLRRRGRTIITIGLVFIAIIVLTLPIPFSRPNNRDSLFSLGLGLLIVLSTVWLARSGRIAPASWILVLMTIVATALPEFIRREASTVLFFLSFAIIIAGVVLQPWQIWPVTGLCLTIIAADAALLSPEVRALPTTGTIMLNATILVMMVGVISYICAQISRNAFALAQQAQQKAQDIAHELEWFNATLETQIENRTMELQEALASVEAQAAEKQKLLDEVAEQREQIRDMSVPVLPVSRHTLVMPLVGTLDSQRLSLLQDEALTAIERTRARTLLLDITGVPIVDSQVAQGLIGTIQAARLLGAEPVLIGIRPEVAQALVALGINLSGLRTASDLQSALRTTT